MKTTENTENTEQKESLTYSVIGAAIEVHRYLGPGLLESTYEKCLARELKLQEIAFKVQVPIPVKYKGIELDCGYRIDLIVEDSLVWISHALVSKSSDNWVKPGFTKPGRSLASLKFSF